MKSKTKNAMTRTLSIVVAAVVILSGCAKIAGLPPLVEIYSKIGLLPYLRVLGVVELVFIVMFLLPRTMKIGFLLLTGYFGGAMAVELSHGSLFIAPGLILSLVWLTAFLRDRSIFLTSQKTNATTLQTATI